MKVLNSNGSMSELTNPLLTPLNVSDVMSIRLDTVSGEDPAQYDFFFKNHLDSADRVVCRGNTIKIVPDANELEYIRLGMKSHNGYWILTPKEYADLDGVEFSLGSLKKAGLNKPLRKPAVLSHPVWRALARDDHLLKEYADMIFAKVKEAWDHDKAMSVVLDYQQRNYLMLTWFLDRVHDEQRSDVVGYSNPREHAYFAWSRSEGEEQRDTLDKAILDKGILDEDILDNKVSDSSGVDESFTYNGQLFVPFYDTKDDAGEL